MYVSNVAHRLLVNIIWCSTINRKIQCISFSCILHLYYNLYYCNCSCEQDGKNEVIIQRFHFESSCWGRLILSTVVCLVSKVTHLLIIVQAAKWPHISNVDWIPFAKLNGMYPYCQSILVVMIMFVYIVNTLGILCAFDFRYPNIINKYNPNFIGP